MSAKVKIINSHMLQSINENKKKLKVDEYQGLRHAE